VSLLPSGEPQVNPIRMRQIDNYAQIAVRVLAVLLALAAVVWVLIDREAWPACLVLAGASVPLAILGGNS
jgi:hypothetical protein